MANIFQRATQGLHDLIYGTPKKYLTPEEAKVTAENIKKSLITMRGNASWAQVEVNAAVEMLRMLPEGNPRIPQLRRTLKLRLVMQQYIEKMTLAMETINSQVELGQLSTEMGAAMRDANQLIDTYKRDMPSFAGFVRDFMKTITPMNAALNGGLDEMSRALDELCCSNLDGMFSEEDIDKLISGEVTKIEPVAAEAAAPAAPAETAAKPRETDLLASLEAELGSWKSKNS